jgi:4-amino-4-deoxy-L-arabinose transferase-like glycosyltransferase
MVAGTVGHEPWKPDEAYTFGLVFHILQSGDWVVPTLGGEPFMEKPPLYYVAAAASANVFAPLLPLHDGARLASTFFVAATTALVALSARRLFGPPHGTRAALLLLGCIGLMMYAHTMITDAALLFGFAVATSGLALALDRPFSGGALLGTGVGVGFLSKGLVEPAMVGIAVAVLAGAFREWRDRRFAIALAWALVFALPWLLVWPTALYLRDPALVREWFWLNNFGRYFGFAKLGAYDEPFYFTRTLPWFTLPAGALGLYAFVGAWRRDRLRLPRGLQLALALCAGILAVLSTSASVRELYALPILVPLSIAASTAVERIPRRIAFGATALMALVALAVALLDWGIWIYGVARGHPPVVAFLAPYLPSTFDFTAQPVLAITAGLITALWVATWILRPGRSWLPLWTSNVALGWGVTMTLLLPWIDDAKSFRAPFAELAGHLPPAACVASVGLGEGQRGMMEYVAGRKTARIEEGPADCPYVLAQTTHDGTLPRLPRGDWRLIWQVARDGETRERFLLYARTDEVERLAANRLRGELAASHPGDPRDRNGEAHARAMALRGGRDADHLSVGVKDWAPASVGRDGH